MCSGQELALSAALTLCRDFCLKGMFLGAESVHAVPLPSRRCAADVLQVQLLCPVQSSVPLVWLLGPCPQAVELRLFPNLCEVALEHEVEEKVWILGLCGFCVCVDSVFVWVICVSGLFTPLARWPLCPQQGLGLLGTVAARSVPSHVPMAAR